MSIKLKALLLINNINQCFSQQYLHLVNWLPCLHIMGIITYFSLYEEPSITIFSMMIIIEILLLIIIIIFKRYFLILIIIFVPLLGFTSSQLRTIIINTPIINKKIYITNMIGKVAKIDYKQSHSKLLLCKVKETPLKVKCLRITVRTKIDSRIQIGDQVKLSVLLYPSPKATSEFAYDFAKIAYFKNISAVGFATSNVILFKKRKIISFFEYIESVRLKIFYNLTTNIKNPQAHIASALFIGKKEGIPDKILQHIRASGLSHLFAISGLHLSFIAALFFILIRNLLATSENFTLKYNIKKISSIITIPIIFIYLLLSGYAVSAQRAFIMVVLVFISNLIDRRQNSTRSLAISAVIILLFEPEYLLSPSFQMSFSAVLSLISSYNISNKLNFNNKLLKYSISTITSSFIATLSTLPYVIYNFNYFSTGGIVSNLLAIPLTTFIIIPVGIVYIFLIPFNLESLLSPILEVSISILLYIAKTSSKADNGIVYIHTFPTYSIITITFGFLLLCLWKGNIKFLSFIFIIIGIYLGERYQTPDLLIDSKNGAIKEENKKLYIFTKSKKNFVTTSWSNQNGQQETLNYKNYKGKNKRLICQNEQECIYTKSNIAILIAKNKHDIIRNCHKVNFIIQLNKFPYGECKTASISYDKLEKYGTHSFRIIKNSIKIRIQHTKRPWHNNLRF